MSLVTQILSKKLGEEVKPDDIVEPELDLLMLTDGTSLIASQNFKKLDKELFDPDRIVIVYDHYCPSNKIQSSNYHNLVREFNRQQGINNFYDCGVGIAHQVLPEEGFIKPGMIITGGDSHTTTQGAFGAFSVGMGATDMAISMASGKTWIKVPWTLKADMAGEMAPGLFGKDAVLKIIGEIGLAGATYRSVEFTGQAIQDLSLPGKMTVCNMAVEMGAKNGIIQPNAEVEEFTRGRFDFDPEDDFGYKEEFQIPAPQEPQVACGISVDDVKGISEVQGTEVDQVYIGSCTNGRYEDLKAAALILKGKEVKTRTLVIPASRKTYLRALETGVLETLIKAGCMVQTPSCGPCIGIHQGVLGDDEVCFSTTNRNFKGRMGSATSQIYLGSAASAAAAALTGKITDPTGMFEPFKEAGI